MGELTDEKKRLIESQDSHDEHDYEPKEDSNGGD